LTHLFSTEAAPFLFLPSFKSYYYHFPAPDFPSGRLVLILESEE